MKNFFKNIGPGPLLAAAFIGPGTVTVCTLSGVQFGYVLLWAMVLSVIATIVLQEMTARLGLVTQKGLSEVLRQEIKTPFLKFLSIALVLSAIVIGNAAYEGGNIGGGVLGLETIFGTSNIRLGAFQLNGFSFLIGIIAFILLYLGNYKVLERALIALVILMSLAFIVTAILTKPDISQLFKGALLPQFPNGSTLLIIALIGTTVVPYNLFLHASLVKEKWRSIEDLGYARKDTFIAIILGGLVSMSVIVSATSISNGQINNAADLALGLEPLFGSFSKYFLAIGLFAAGITSAITAPLAAAYVATGCLGWDSNLKSIRFRLVWGFILVLGVCISSSGFKPIEIIKFAQIANGILLPIITGFLLWVMNRSELLGKYKNSNLTNSFGVLIFVISMLLAIAAINKVFDLNLF
ncbi:NRAMP (natural resistance-associated macrophage protein) metal ion transporters [Hyunsoonleella jejuensis]|uniref:NRAMP (Natural resistance-associated macrophage protein) metal ion transporters n=1 Tax=Hyunsoonleella jejuensis TaxID=419940 RepID=A0A1H9GU92_9FLAO|nr:Nramp family divalent metal transporter [Hyunsoonleella jejuensis]SEQ53642.1 NRAMP (natural resistance-associated macrophage protein) metal ion transporters [Hyunsoonleella jejuensis]